MADMQNCLCHHEKCSRKNYKKHSVLDTVRKHSVLDTVRKHSVLGVRTSPSTVRKQYVQKKIDDLANSFTIHGLSHTVRGKKIESVFWSTILVIGVLCSCVIIHGLVSKFVSRLVYTEIRFQITDKNYFPSVTICEKKLLIASYFAYCGIHPILKGLGEGVNNSEPCPRVKRYSETKTDESDTEYGYWATDMFNVTKCFTWGGIQCSKSKYFRPAVHLNNSCITWNYAGGLYDMYSSVEMEFRYTAPSYLGRHPEIIAIVHDPKIREIDMTRKIDLSPHRHYDIKLDKTIIRRLPAPYPANCSDEKSEDMFPGKYSRYACIESHNLIDMYKRCGVTIDYARDYIPKPIREQYEKKPMVSEALRCLRSHLRKELNQSSNCPFPCEDFDVTIIPSVREQLPSNESDPFFYKLTIQYQRVDTYKLMEEKPMYTWDQMACEIGGFIGLVMGLSVISLVEVVAYVFLRIVKSFL